MNPELLSLLASALTYGVIQVGEKLAGIAFESLFNPAKALAEDTVMKPYEKSKVGKKVTEAITKAAEEVQISNEDREWLQKLITQLAPTSNKKLRFEFVESIVAMVTPDAVSSDFAIKAGITNEKDKTRLNEFLLRLRRHLSNIDEYHRYIVYDDHEETRHTLAQVLNEIRTLGTTVVDIKKQVNFTLSSSRKLKHIPLTSTNPIFGRDDIVEEVNALLGKNDKVLLYGFGGTGKTSLALKMSEQAIADEKRFPNGVLWLTVLDKKLEDLCADVLADFQIDSDRRMKLDEKAKYVRQLLGNEQLLIVLDDVEADLNTGDNITLQWLKKVHPPNTPLLVTSRSELAKFVGIEIKELPEDAALNLLEHHSGRAWDKTSKKTRKKICTELGNHPLALLLMGEYLKHYFPTNPDEALAQLGEAHERVKQLKIGKGDEKDVNVYLSLEFSWDKLDSDQKLIVGILSGYAGPTVGRELIKLSCGMEEDKFNLAVSALYRQSLIDENTNSAIETPNTSGANNSIETLSRFSSHSLIKAFCRAKLEEERNWEAVEKAVVTGCTLYSKTHNSGSDIDNKYLQVEQKNLFGSATLAEKQKMFSDVQELAMNIFHYSGFVKNSTMLTREKLPLLDAGIKAAQYTNNISNEYWLTLCNGNSYYAGKEIGRSILDATVNSFETALRLARDLNYTREIIRLLFILGNLYSEMGYLKDAKASFEEGLALNQKEDNAWVTEIKYRTSLVETLIRLRQLESASDQARIALARIEEYGYWDQNLHGRLLRTSGDTNMLLKRHKEAADDYKIALSILRRPGEALTKKNADVVFNIYMNMGNCYAILKEYESAEIYYQNANTASQASFFTWGNTRHMWLVRAESSIPLGGTQVLNGKVVTGVKKIHTGLRIARKNTFRDNELKGLHMLANVYSEELKKDRLAVIYYEKTLRLAKDLEVQWVEKEALKYLAKFYLDNKDRFDTVIVQSRAGDFFRREEKFDLAFQGLNAALRLSPNDVYALVAMADTYWDMKQHDKAFAFYSRVIEIDPKNSHALARRGVLYQEKHQYQNAINDLDRAVKLEVRTWYITARYKFALKTRADTYWEMNKREEAIKDYKILLPYNVNIVQPDAKRAQVYRLLKQYDRAISTAKSAVEKDGNDISALEALAATYWDMKKYDEAIAELTRILDLKPDILHIRAWRGNAYRIKKQYENAIDDLDQVLASDPKYLYALQTLGQTYFNMGKFTDAIRKWNQLLEINPQNNYVLKMRDHVYCLIFRKAINYVVTDFKKIWEVKFDEQWIPMLCQTKDNFFSNPFDCIADNSVSVLNSTSMLWSFKGQSKLRRLMWINIINIIGVTFKNADDMQMFKLMKSIRILLVWGIRLKPKLQDPYKNCWETILSKPVSK